MKYFDYAATTPCDELVLKAMQPYWNIEFGNPNSRSHSYGWQAEAAIEKSRSTLAKILNVEPSEIIFTSGATESNNLAIKGFVNNGFFNKKTTIASLITEHKCIIETLRYLKQYQNIDIDFIPVLSDGLINMDYLKKNINKYSLISVGYVNNETGVIQDIPYISKLCRQNNVKLHSDAAQAFAKIQINVREVDLLSISGHKIYGPKGIGALFVSKNPRIRIKALFNGGGQENNMRSGTLSTPLCVGLAKAAQLCSDRINEDYIKFKEYSDYIIQNVVEKLEYVSVNGALNSKIPNILNLNVPYIEGESLLMKLNKFALSSGSACTSKSLEPSYVISAMHPEEKDLAHSSIRISFGKFTTLDDVKLLSKELIKHIQELRNLSPLWHMIKKGVDLKSILWRK